MAFTAAGVPSVVSVAELAVGQEVTVHGRLDANTVAEVRLALRDILDRGVGDLLVHLANAEVHDATGLGVIVGVHDRARRVGRRLVLVDMSPRLDRLLRGSRLHLVLVRGLGEGAVTFLPPAESVLRSAESHLPLGNGVLPFTG
jgi:anti-anti-sigma factor